MTSYTLGQKFIAPTKPERGVFPLDHEGSEEHYSEMIVVICRRM